MNPVLKAAIGGVARAIGAYAAGKSINLDNEALEFALEAVVVGLIAGWSVWQKRRADRKLKQAAATGGV
jgi:tagatose-1,6-bisphosphate aldolase